LVGASGAISSVFGIAAVVGNTRAYYWLVLQIVFAVIGSISALPIAFTAHVGGFIAGVLMTKVLVDMLYFVKTITNNSTAYNIIINTR
jgi:rhomboid protease GluP